MSAPPAPTQSCEGGFLGLLDCSSGTAGNRAGQSGGQLIAALAVSFASLGVQLLCFAIIRLRLSRIYRPRSYLVPERERVTQPPGGVVGWLYPLFTVSNLTIIQKCGLDAYFFLRFLRMLLKIFLPMALIVLPILLPINHSAHGDAKGLDKYSISNLGPQDGNFLWAHVILAVLSIAWFFYVVFKELRGYIRVRQAYLTSPQHRIRASATTVLVTGIPRKWLTLEALSGLYDVFPGGIRNIWINRNFDELSDKVQLRDKVAKSLEDAETALIKMCRKKNAEAEKKKAKKDGRKKKTKEEKKQDRVDEDAAAEKMAQGDGISAGEQQQVSHGMQDILEQEEHQQEKYDKQSHNPFGAVTHGLGAVGKGIGKFGGKVVVGADAGFHKAGDNFNRTANALNDGGLGGGFVADESLFASPHVEGTQLASRPGTAGSRRTGDRAAMDTIPRQTRHPMAVQPVSDKSQGSPISNESTLGVSSLNAHRPSGDSKPKSALEIEEPPAHKPKRKFLDLFKNADDSFALPSPQPHMQEEDEFPLHARSEKHPETTTEKEIAKSGFMDKLKFWKSKDTDEPKEEYPTAIDKDWDEDQDEEPFWRRYMEAKDRETMRLPLFSLSWFPSIPLVGKKVDRIYHLRRELARLNLEVEADQNDVEKFPYMNSAFIQFNQQVAAHMCCQSLSHHVPQQMAPRLVEISPDDVIWDNMSIKWWERYVRSGVVLLVCAGLVILWAIPVAFTSVVGQITQLATFVPWLGWLADAPKWIQSVIQGVLPPLLLSLILLLVPIIFRLLVQQQGVPTGNAKELGVQQWYFAFLFIQVFLVVTIVGGLTKFFSNLAENPASIVQTLAKTLPGASNYFYSYLTVQALSNSASALLQTGSLVAWFIFAPMFDSTARSKWRRQTTLSNIQWGSFFPPFTNFAAIGVIYSVISPLMLVFMLFVFSLFWIVYRYNVLFVYQFRTDTGGRLFPVAINQLFTGLYFLELCMIGLCFTVTNHPAIAQAVIMIVVLVATIAFQVLVNLAFKPLFQYLPITLEDEAVIRDEEFARAQASKFAPLTQPEDTRDIQEVLEDHEREEDEAGDIAEDEEERRIAEHKRSHTPNASGSPDIGRKSSTPQPEQGRWHERKESKPIWATDKWKRVAPEAVGALRFIADGRRTDQPQQDPEAQNTVGDVLFSGFADELEDLSPEERDLLVRYSFQHSALRARRPVVWIPRDVLGVSDDEIKRAKKMSTVRVPSEDGGEEEKTNIWMSNEGTALDNKGRVVFRRSPPDFSNMDLIVL